MITPKSEISALHLETILNNAVYISGTESFYEFISKNNGRNEIKGMLPTEQREFWRSRLQIEKEENVSILKVSVSDEDSEWAIQTVRQVSLDLAARLSSYYNIKNDWDIRLISDPEIKENGGDIIKIFFKSLLIGLVAGLLDYFFISLFPEGLSRKKAKPIKPILTKIDFQKKESLRPEPEYDFNASGFQYPGQSSFPSRNMIEHQKDFFAEIKKNNGNEKEIPFCSAKSKKAPAPVNLPIAPDNLSVRSGTEKAKSGEEEVKERLNKLLSGQV